jgi:hypothetical protein
MPSSVTLSSPEIPVNRSIMLCIIDYIDEDMVALSEAQGGPRQRAINNTTVRKALQGMYTELRGKQSGAMTCSLISNVSNVTP